MSIICFSGDPEASFTKEQMHAGKHQEYEKKLHEALLSKATTTTPTTGVADVKQNSIPVEIKQTVKNKTEIPQQTVSSSVTKENGNSAIKEGWPLLEKEKNDTKKVESKTKAKNKVKSFTNNNNNNVSKKADKAGKNCERNCQNKTPEMIVKEEKPPSEDEIEINTTTTTKINIIDDNSSFFSQNTFHKLTLKDDEETISATESSSDDSSPNSVHTTVLSESLPDINSTEDWEAAFGFTKHSNHLEELAKLRNGGGSTNLLDVLTGNKTAFVPYKQQEERIHTQYFGGNGVSNGIKFFADFYKNGYNSEQHNYLVMQNKRQIEDQLLNMKYGNHVSSHLLLQQQQQQQNGVNSSQFLNFDGLYQTKGSGTSGNRTHAEDELDFDPFQETQKGLAELLENEQNHKMLSNSAGNLFNLCFSMHDV